MANNPHDEYLDRLEESIRSVWLFISDSYPKMSVSSRASQLREHFAWSKCIYGFEVDGDKILVDLAVSRDCKRNIVLF